MERCIPHKIPFSSDSRTALLGLEPKISVSSLIPLDFSFRLFAIHHCAPPRASPTLTKPNLATTLPNSFSLARYFKLSPPLSNYPPLFFVFSCSYISLLSFSCYIYPIIPITFCRQPLPKASNLLWISLTNSPSPLFFPRSSDSQYSCLARTLFVFGYS